MPFFPARTFIPSVALFMASSKTPARLARFPLKPTPMQEGRGLGCFMKQGDRRMTGRQFSKKKHMKTTSQKNTETGSLKNQSNQSSTPQAAAQTATAPQAQPEKKDNRLPIDTEARKQNRTLPTEKVLALLQQQDRRLWEMAEVVGKWIWVSFSEQPAPTVRQTLAQLGFHWNRTRQAWQHPCGQFRLSSASDPHEKYQAYHPADATTN